MGKIVIVKRRTSPSSSFYGQGRTAEASAKTTRGTHKEGGENCSYLIENKLENKPGERLLMVLFDEKRPYMMETAPLLTEESILGNIYLARVKNVVSGLSGAFLSISKDETVYLPLSRCREILVANRELKEGESIRQGDEVVVQITGEALKTKQPAASERLSLTGQYCVCSYFGHGVHYSRKLTEQKKKEIDGALKARELQGRKGYQFTVRTNAEGLEDFEPLFQEMQKFIHIFDTITEIYRSRTCYSLLYQKEAELLSRIKNIPLTAYDEIVTDEEDVCSFLEKSFPHKPVRLYRDELLPLAKLYSLDAHLKEALEKKVWLPCGGYLVMEPTEAMVVIDVNSGKTISKGKKSRDYYLKVNLEAAGEVARQLRLRNYSGMIMVDFINMDSEDDDKLLLEALDKALREDKVKTRLVDMTALGIVEITRKKINRPLSDFFHLSDFFR
ncbi:MAG: ribonuclease E/G [Clostridium sp.]|nr:ribonuclease E/G [Clostridium sp.]